MNAIQMIVDRMRLEDSETALFWKDKAYSYSDFMKLIDAWIFGK